MVEVYQLSLIHIFEEGWPDRVVAMQRNWIGRSEGTEVDFRLEGTEKEVRVFTTRVDTIFGATCVILAPQHPWVADLGLTGKAAPLIAAQKEKGAEDLEKDGFFTGHYAVNPVSYAHLDVYKRQGQDLWHERAQIPKAVRPRHQHDYGQVQRIHVLLVNQVAIRGDEDIEALLRTGEEIAVRESAPSLIDNR